MDMLTVAILSQKGDVGKTTLAINLSVASELAGRAALIVDLDPQASAAAWADSREATAPVVVSAQAARLAEVLTTARENIDTAPTRSHPRLSVVPIRRLRPPEAPS